MPGADGDARVGADWQAVNIPVNKTANTMQTDCLLKINMVVSPIGQAKGQICPQSTLSETLQQLIRFQKCSIPSQIK
jgi:hypothetical protein